MLSVWLVGCGGGSPTSTPPVSSTDIPAGTVLRLVSGDTGAPVVGASVNIAGQGLRTDATGSVTLRLNVGDKATTDVVADGFLRRFTLLRKGDTTFPLWPRLPSDPSDFLTQQIVYTQAYSGAPLGVFPLNRVSPSIKRVALVPGPEIARDAQAMDVQYRVAAVMTAATEGQIQYFVQAPGESLSVDAKVTMNVDSRRCGPYAGCINVSQDNNYTGSADAFLATVDVARDFRTVLHETGHSFGLQHAAGGLERGIVMGVTGVPIPVSDFSPEEKFLMRMMLKRLAGNRWPDADDTVLTTASRARSSVTISCNFPR
jgi:hypothetical protein